jgi:hypothetical protein
MRWRRVVTCRDEVAQGGHMTPREETFVLSAKLAGGPELNIFARAKRSNPQGKLLIFRPRDHHHHPDEPFPWKLGSGRPSEPISVSKPSPSRPIPLCDLNPDDLCGAPDTRASLRLSCTHAAPVIHTRLSSRTPGFERVVTAFIIWFYSRQLAPHPLQLPPQLLHLNTLLIALESQLSYTHAKQKAQIVKTKEHAHT